MTNTSSTKNSTIDINQIVTDLNNKADKDLNNVEDITDSSVLNGVNTKRLTNCLLEVPQRVKLELADGTLTLKAGSEIIVPNGFEADGVTPKFDYVIVQTDISGGTGEGNYFYCYNPSQNLYGATQVVSSGESVSNPQNAQYWYDTKNNKVKRYINSAWVEGYCLPFCIAATSEIKQVFNGIGYIGSTVWVDKGVKFLAPNGRNEDGTLNNIEFTTSKIVTYTNPSNYTFSNYGWVMARDLYIVPYDLTMYKYNEQENYNYELYGGNKHFSTLFASCSVNGGVISNFQPKLPFRAVGYNDKPEISGWAMPSDKYIDLTLGASGTTYTAPANGWFCLSKQSNGASQYVELGTSHNGLKNRCMTSVTNAATMTSLPVAKGVRMYATYSTGGATNLFRFVYAEGET